MVSRDGWMAEHRSLIEDVDALAGRLLPKAAASGPLPEIPSSPAATGGGRLLDRLRQAAVQKQREDETRTGQMRRRAEGLSEALEAAYRFFGEFARQLNILQPERPRPYPFHGTIAFEHLCWRHGETDYQLRANQGEQRIFDKVTLRFRVAASEKLRLEREPPALGQLREALDQHRIPHMVEEVRNELGNVVRGVFVITPELPAYITLWAEDETGQIRLRTHNIDRFGLADFAIAATALDVEALEELGQLVLGEPNRFLQKFRRLS